LIDDTGRELFARNASTQLPNASTTKMTTALVVREHAAGDEPVLVSATAAATGGGGLDLQTGQIFTVEGLLYALLLDSSNDAAVALAEHVAGSHEAFVGDMNAMVRGLGATDTHYVTAHGLDMPGHGSSARDLALIAGAVLDDPVLARIVGSSTAQIEGPAGTISLENRNLLLEGYAGATGVKTGFTADAGNVLVASAERGGRRLIAVAMHSVDATVDARALLDYGWGRLARTVMLQQGTEVAALVFDQGSTRVVAATSVRGADPQDELTYEFLPSATVSVPLSAGDVVGRVAVMADGQRVDTVDALAVGSVVPDQGSWADDIFAGLLRTVGELVSNP
jgi:D-alanyl-D-alanine carboxypeptidase (penicillin-binding protein 5/6)